MGAAGAAAAAEVERACKEACAIVSSLLTASSADTDIGLTDDIQAWHRSNISFGEAYCLLWQDDKEGTVSYRYSRDDIKARLCAAHIIDLLLAGRVKLYWASKTKFMKGEYLKLRLMVSSTNAVSVPATTGFLQHLNVLQEARLAKGKNPISLFKLLEGQLMWKPGSNMFNLEKETFAGLVDRGILTKEKQKQWVFFKATIYPTNDPTPEAMLVQDLRALMKREIPSTVHLELLIKLIAKTSKVFTEEEEACDEKLKSVRKSFKHEPAFTLLEKSYDGGSNNAESPFTPNEELSVRLLVNQAELA